MKKLLIFKHLAAAVILLAVIFSFSAGFSAQTVYKTLIELPTEASSGWKAANSVTLSANTVKKAEKAAVSFTSRDLTVDGEYRFSAQWSEFGVKAAEMVLKTDIFISDISILNSGAITLSADDGHGFSWRMTDLSLKSGWNSITLNLRTADIVRPQVKEETETEEEETATEEEASTEEEPKKELTPDEILLSVNKFAFEAKKTQEKEMTVAFSGLSVSVPTKEEPPEPPKPITDDADKSLVTVAAVIAVVLIAAVFVYSAYSAKKEIKRRKREAKKRKLEKLQEENKNEE